jgi:hypothetical protein
MNRYWVSWVQETNDFRPTSFPPGKQILGWWCTGFTSGEDAILCALVSGTCEADAMTAIWREWPEANEWRFFQEVSNDWRPTDRFPIKDWMKERIEVAT